MGRKGESREEKRWQRGERMSNMRKSDTPRFDIILAPMSRDGMTTEPQLVVSIIHLSDFHRHFKKKSVVTNRTIPFQSGDIMRKCQKISVSPDLVTSISENPY